MIRSKYRVKITPVHKDHAACYGHEMAVDMREEDKKECEIIGIPPEAAVATSIEDSKEVYEARYKGTLLCVFGVAGNAVWCLGTQSVKNHRKALVCIGYSFIQEVVRKYGELGNFISKENIQAIRYIENVPGVDLYEGNVTINGKPFLYFELRRKDHV